MSPFHQQDPYLAAAQQAFGSDEDDPYLAAARSAFTPLPTAAPIMAAIPEPERAPPDTLTPVPERPTERVAPPSSSVLANPRLQALVRDVPFGTPPLPLPEPGRDLPPPAPAPTRRVVRGGPEDLMREQVTEEVRGRSPVSTLVDAIQEAPAVARRAMDAASVGAQRGGERVVEVAGNVMRRAGQRMALPEPQSELGRASVGLPPEPRLAEPGPVSTFLEQKGRDIARGAQERASVLPTNRRLREVESVGDFIEWAAGATAQGLASTAPSIAGAAAGGVVAGVPGALIGALGPGYAQNQHEVRTALQEEGVSEEEADRISSVAAVPMAALDAIMPARLGAQITGQTRKQVARGLARRVLSTMAQGGITELPTEAGQSVIEQLTTQAVTGKPIDWMQVVEEGAAGGLTGMAAGAAGGVRGPGLPTEPTATEAQPTTEQEVTRPEPDPEEALARIRRDLEAEEGPERPAEPSTAEPIVPPVEGVDRGVDAPVGPGDIGEPTVSGGTPVERSEMEGVPTDEDTQLAGSIRPESPVDDLSATLTGAVEETTGIEAAGSRQDIRDQIAERAPIGSKVRLPDGSIGTVVDERTADFGDMTADEIAAAKDRAVGAGLRPEAVLVAVENPGAETLSGALEFVPVDRVERVEDPAPLDAGVPQVPSLYTRDVRVDLLSLDEVRALQTELQTERRRSEGERASYLERDLTALDLYARNRADREAAGAGSVSDDIERRIAALQDRTDPDAVVPLVEEIADAERAGTIDPDEVRRLRALAIARRAPIGAQVRLPDGSVGTVVEESEADFGAMPPEEIAAAKKQAVGAGLTPDEAVLVSIQRSGSETMRGALEFVPFDRVERVGDSEVFVERSPSLTPVETLAPVKERRKALTRLREQIKARPAGGSGESVLDAIEGARAAGKLDDRQYRTIKAESEGRPTRYAKLEDAALEDRMFQLWDRLQKTSEALGPEIKPWARYDDDIDATRSGTAITGKGGRLLGRMKDDGRIVDEIEAELVSRGIDLEEVSARYSGGALLPESGPVADALDEGTRRVLDGEDIETVADDIAGGLGPTDLEGTVGPEPAMEEGAGAEAGVPRDGGEVQGGLLSGTGAVVGDEQTSLLTPGEGRPPEVIEGLSGEKLRPDEFERIRGEARTPEGDQPLPFAEEDAVRTAEARVEAARAQVERERARAEAGGVVEGQEMDATSITADAAAALGRLRQAEQRLLDAERELATQRDPASSEGAEAGDSFVLSSEDPTRQQQGGFLDAGAIKRGVKAFVRRNFTSRGDLPGKTLENKVLRDGWFNAQMKRASHTARDYKKALRTVYGLRGPTESDVASLDAVLKGGDPATIPGPMRPVLQRMRDEIDALSAKLVAEGVIEGPLVATVTENLGVYATRSYRVFDDPAWAEKVDPAVRNRAKAFFRGEYPNKTDAEIEGLIDHLLYKRGDGPIAMLAKGKLGSKDLSILQRRKEIAPEIRELWGEYEDPRVNYTRSVAKMAHLLANHQFLEAVRGEGIGTYFFEEPTSGFHVEFAAKGSKVLEPLNGLYTSPEINQASHDAMGEPVHGALFRLYMKINSASKFSKTVGSLMTHIRNLIGNTGFAVANGHWRIFKGHDAVKATLSSLGIGNEAKWRAYYQRAQELGVVHESIHAGELHDAVEDATKRSLDSVTGSRATKAAKGTVKGFAEVYHAEDAVWKVYAWENEKTRYRKARPGWTEAQVEEHTAEIVRNTYPTYSLVPRAVRLIRRIPLIGPFVSFPAEVFRTGYHTLSLVSQELADPATRRIGAERLVGLMIATVGIPAVTAASRFLTGTDDEEDEAVREFLPPWSEHSSLVHLSNSPNGKPNVVDLSYTDPYSYIRTPLIAFLRGEDWQEKLTEAALEAAAPFVSEEILAGKLADIARNQTAEGREVWNPQDDPLTKFEKQLAHLYDAIEPGTISSARRIAQGLSGKATASGVRRNPQVEALAVFTGHRIMEVDVRRSLWFRAREFREDLSNAQRILLSTTARRGPIEAADVQKAQEQTERRRRELIDAASRTAHAAQLLGMTKEEVNETFRNAGVSAAVTRQVMREIPYQPYQPSESFFRRLERSPGEQPDYDERRRMLGVPSNPPGTPRPPRPPRPRRP